MIKNLIICLLISSLASSQNAGWSLNGDTLRYSDGAGNTIQINKTSSTVGGSLCTLENPSAIRYIKINANNTVSLRTAADMLSDIGAQATLVSSTNIKTINGATILGSGDMEVVGSGAAWGSITGTLSSQSDLNTALGLKANLASPTFTGTPVVPGYMPSTATVGVANCPTASGTQTITHNLGRTPTVIEIYGVGRFTSNAAATPTPFSSGTWTSVSGNSCVYMTSAGTTTQDGLSSTTFSVFIATSSGNNMSGVIQNVGATTFDIVWTETGTAAALPFRWKTQ